MPPEASGARPKVFFYVQHLLGIGHLLRAARIVKALDADGFSVLLVLGGTPPADLDVGGASICQLPPVRAGSSGFTGLVHADGSPFTAADQAERSERLSAAFDHFAPEVLITEAFPFGRNQVRFELLPLLARAKGRVRPPLIAASIRDILQREGRPDRVARTVDLIQRFFDLVLVHGDPRVSQLGDTFPEADRFAGKVVYTGLVAPDAPTATSELSARYAAVVSVGGGAVGLPLLEAALGARRLTRIADQPWLFLTGPNLPAEARALIDREKRTGVAVERFVPDLAGLLTQADVSVSQAGYNTVSDILVAGCRAVLVPFVGDKETEQTDRATLLERRAFAVVVTEAQLTPERLAAAIDLALDRPKNRLDIDLEGARSTGRFLREALAARTGARTGFGPLAELRQ